MKCSKCGNELNKHARFCKKCGTPVADCVPADSDYESRYETMVFDPPKPVVHTEPLNQQKSAPPAAEYSQPQEPAFSPAPAQRNRRAEFEQLYSPAPTAPAPTAPAPEMRSHAAPAKKKPAALIISVVALVLVILIGAGVILFIYPGVARSSDSSSAKVSAAELEEAKKEFLPPAQAIQIDTAAEDPSNDDIQFKYDERNRIVSCSYTVKKKTYDQSYTYNDAGQQVTIATTYRDNDIATKEISYAQVTTPDTFVTIDGYYLRLDEASLAGGTAASEARMPHGPQGLATEAPADSSGDEWKTLYINYLKSLDITGYSGKLIYLNDDDTPEFVHFSGTGADTSSYRLCWIVNGEVQTQDITGLERFYLERTGYVKSVWSAQSSGSWTGYYFDGTSLTEEQKGYWSYDSSIMDKQYTVDDMIVSEEDYNAALGDISSWSKMSEDTTAGESLPEYIRAFG